MGRKGTFKYGKGEKSTISEREGLLADKDQDKNKPVRKTNNLSLPPSTPVRKKSLERKKSIWAPVATATTFEDVPVFTICPYCSSKVVTKTQFKRGRKHWCYCCCCLPYFMDVFKDVIHVCPKCNTQIAIYNRFNFFKTRASQTPNQKTPADLSQTSNQQSVSNAPTANPNLHEDFTKQITNQISPISLSTNQQQIITTKTVHQQLSTSKPKGNFHQPLSRQSSSHNKSQKSPKGSPKLTTKPSSLTTSTSSMVKTTYTASSTKLDTNNASPRFNYRHSHSASWHHFQYDQR